MVLLVFPCLSMINISRVIVSVGNCCGDSHGGILSGNRQQVVKSLTVTSPLIPLDAPCSGIFGALNASYLSPVRLSMMNIFCSIVDSSNPISPSPSVNEKRRKSESEFSELCIIEFSERPINSISGISENPGDCTHAVMNARTIDMMNIFVIPFKSSFID